MSERFTYLRERLLPELPERSNEATLEHYRRDLARSLGEWYRQNLRAIRELDSNPALTVARVTSNQDLTPATPVRIAFNAVTVDTHGWWNASTNEYLPLEPGFYRCSWMVDFHDTAAIAATTYMWAQLDVGTVQSYRFIGYGNDLAQDVMVAGSAVVECSGSTTGLSVSVVISAGTAPSILQDVGHDPQVYRSWFSVDYIGRRRIA